MIDWFLSGGVIMWPLLMLVLGVCASAARAGMKLRTQANAVGDSADASAAASAGLDFTLVPILFWGALALLVGTLGTVAGLVIMARRVAEAGGASAGLLWGGVGVALGSLAFGILIFLLSGSLWFLLDAWRRRLMSHGRGTASVFLLLALGGVAAGCGETDRGRFTVTDSAGIRVAANTGPDRSFPALPVRVGSLQPPDSALTAMPWGVVADPVTGQVFVADGTSERVVVFTANGAYVRTIGRAGGGPGEFRSPTALALDESGALAVWDAQRGIISRWSAEGDLLNEQRAPVSYWGPGFAIRRDGVVVVTETTTGDQRRQSLVKASGGGGAVEIFAVTQDLVPLRLPGMDMAAPRIFAPDVVWTARGDTILVLDGPGYRVDAYVGGRLVGSARRDVGPIPVTGEMAAARVAGGPYQGFMRRMGLTPVQIAAALGYEEVTSPVEWIATDPSGNLWLSRGSGRAVPDRVDVLDGGGRYLGTFDAPYFPVAFLSDTLFVALEITELDQPLLGLFRLEARSNPVDADRGSDLVTPASERPLADGEFRDCHGCPVMIPIPPGRFVMGRAPDEALATQDPNRPAWTQRAEEPRIEAEIAYPFALGKYEVTWSEWELCVRAGGCATTPEDGGYGRGDRPVIHVTRQDALDYAAWLGTHAGRRYRLPSEAEWEYAARAGTGTARWWGEELGVGRTVCVGCGSRWDNRSTAPVGSFPANPFGLHDMLGNVSEWIADCWHPSHDGQPGDGTARVETSPWWKDGACERPMRKGGAWSHYPWATRAAQRGFWRPRPVPPPWPDHSSSGGFRVAAELPDAGPCRR
jgi:formylglycine-generating enzyme required for sulfatase activity